MENKNTKEETTVFRGITRGKTELTNYIVLVWMSGRTGENHYPGRQKR